MPLSLNPTHEQREMIFASTDFEGDLFEVETSMREPGWFMYVGTSNPQGSYLTTEQARSLAAALLQAADVIDARNGEAGA